MHGDSGRYSGHALKPLSGVAAPRACALAKPVRSARRLSVRESAWPSFLSSRQGSSPQGGNRNGFRERREAPRVEPGRRRRPKLQLFQTVRKLASGDETERLTHAGRRFLAFRLEIALASSWRARKASPWPPCARKRPVLAPFHAATAAISLSTPTMLSARRKL